MTVDLSDYVEVAERIQIFRAAHPQGSLQSEVLFADDGSWVLCKAWAYRDPDDPRPGVGHSRLSIPGSTPYTRGSEVENAETSAWGRAIVAALAADAKRVASKDEVAAKTVFTPPADVVQRAQEAQARTQPQDGGIPSEVVVHFGKNNGKRLGELTRRQLEWLANDWEEKPAYPWTPQDRRLKFAAQQLLGGNDSPPVDDSIPF